MEPAKRSLEERLSAIEENQATIAKTYHLIETQLFYDREFLIRLLRRYDQFLGEIYSKEITNLASIQHYFKELHEEAEIFLNEPPHGEIP